MLTRLLCVTLAVLVSHLFPVLALAHPQFTNEPAGMTPWAEYNANTVAQGCFLNYGSGAIVSDAAAPYSGPNVLQSVRPQSGQGGSKLECSVYSGGYATEVFWGGWIKPSNPFMGWSDVDSQKFVTWGFLKTQIWGVFHKHQTGNPTGSAVWGIYNPQLRGDNKHITQGIWRCDASAGTCHYHTGVNVQFGQYAKVEIYSRTSSCTTCRDGYLKMWINGQPTLINYENYNTETGAGYEVILQNASWDRFDPAYSSYVGAGNPTDKWWYDHWYVSIGKRVGGGSGGVGSGGGGGGDTTAPPVPQNVTVTVD